MKYWEIIAHNLGKARWSWGSVSALDSQGRTIWIADAHRGDGRRFIVRADEKLTAFVELESALKREANARSESIAAVDASTAQERRAVRPRSSWARELSCHLPECYRSRSGGHCRFPRQ